MLCYRVVDNVAVNKMSAANMVRIFGPTLMTVDSDESTFINATFEFSVIELMFRHYLWMFQVRSFQPMGFWLHNTYTGTHNRHTHAHTFNYLYKIEAQVLQWSTKAKM